MVDHNSSAASGTAPRTAGKQAGVRPRGPQTAPAAQTVRAKTKIWYRAVAPCRLGRYLDAGERVFWERFDPCPAHLEELDDPADESCKFKKA